MITKRDFHLSLRFSLFFMQPCKNVLSRNETSKTSASFCTKNHQNPLSSLGERVDWSCIASSKNTSILVKSWSQAHQPTLKGGWVVLVRKEREGFENSKIKFFGWTQQLAGCFAYVHWSRLPTYSLPPWTVFEVEKPLPPKTQLVRTLTMFGLQA